MQVRAATPQGSASVSSEHWAAIKTLNLENGMERDGRMKVGFEGRFKGKIMKLGGKGTYHATIQAKFRSSVKFQGRETKIKGGVLVQLGAEIARLLDGK